MGHDLIHGFQRVMAYTLPLIFVVVSVHAFGTADLTVPFQPEVAGNMGFSGAFLLTAAIQAARSMSFSAYASDYSRYLPQDTQGRKVFAAAAGGTLIASVWIGSLGAAIGTHTNVGTPADLVDRALPSALGVLTLVCLFLTNTATACLDCYSGSLAGLLLDLPMRRWHSVLLVGAIGGTIGWIGGQGDYWANFQTFLFLLGYWIGPWLGVMLVYLERVRPDVSAEVFFDRRRRVRPGLIAWLVGFLASVPFMNQYGLFVGPVAEANPHLGDLTAVVGFLVGAAACWLGFRLASDEAPDQLTAAALVPGQPS
jgi:NCS1 family nucleobase:cation symporter-1